jgi:hypothetical protein
MMALRIPFLSRLMIFDVRLERICPQSPFPILVSEKRLRALHEQAMAQKERCELQTERERMKLYAGGPLIR